MLATNVVYKEYCGAGTVNAITKHTDLCIITYGETQVTCPAVYKTIYTQ